MKHLSKLMTMPVALVALALPGMAGDGFGHDHGRRGHDRGRRPVVINRGPSVGFGFGVGPAYPVAPYPAYPSTAYPSGPYPANPGYPDSPYPDPYAANNDPYGMPYPDTSYDPSVYDNGAANYSVYAPMAPPPVRNEYCPPAPGPGYAWVGGFWRWGGANFAWSPGYWVRRPARFNTWVGGGWFNTGNRYGWRRGYWR